MTFNPIRKMNPAFESQRRQQLLSTVKSIILVRVQQILAHAEAPADETKVTPADEGRSVSVAFRGITGSLTLSLEDAEDLQRKLSSHIALRRAEAQDVSQDTTGAENATQGATPSAGGAFPTCNPSHLSDEACTFAGVEDREL